MSSQESPRQEAERTSESSADKLKAAQAKEAGSDFEWHFGRVTRLGNFEIAGGREVTIMWEEGGLTSQQGNITDGQWEIFKLAFMTTGRISVLSDEKGNSWMYDYRFLEAVK
ncbi:MAG: hypothetical protein WBM44_24165 [Waterburya sp.]